MLEIRRILCPIDFSHASQLALEQAAMIAGWFTAPITVLHVTAPRHHAAVSSAAHAATAAGGGVAVEPQLHASLEECVRPLRAAGLTVDELVLEDYDVEGRILASAASLHADLLVLGTHGRTGFGWLMIGSVTEHVLRKAPCPVLTVPPAATRPAKPPFKHVLCPIAFDDPSLEALRFALGLAQADDARLTLLHVLPDPGGVDAPARDTEVQRRRREEIARHRLEALVPAEARVFCTPQARVASGTAYRRIVETAVEQAADLIVMGVGRRGIIDRMFVGSTTNQVVRRAECPVLTVRK